MKDKRKYILLVNVRSAVKNEGQDEQGPLLFPAIFVPLNVRSAVKNEGQTEIYSTGECS